MGVIQQLQAASYLQLRVEEWQLCGDRARMAGGPLAELPDSPPPFPGQRQMLLHPAGAAILSPELFLDAGGSPPPALAALTVSP